jgi:uncharacterized protein
MIAVDTNILVYSHREDAAFFNPALATIITLAESDVLWAIPWPVIHEFLAIVTHPGIYTPSTPMENALLQVESWMACPSLSLIGESGEIYFQYLAHVLRASRTTGAGAHDARIAAICLSHGVDELMSADRDFSRFPGLKVRNPLV